MQWENLTSPDFQRAVAETGVCIIAMGVMERHGDHLPLGTDFLNGHRIACLAAEREPAVVHPPFYFGQIYEAAIYPGTITLPPRLLLEVIGAVFDEIGRNGFRKIVVYNAHGGNGHLLPLLAQFALAEEKPYCLYLPADNALDAARRRRWRRLLATPHHGHACECETSISLANHPELVHPERIPATPGDARERLAHLPPTFTGVHWYAQYPEHYAGDARAATREKGLALRQLLVDGLADYLAAVKADRAVPALQQEFFRRRQTPGRH
jgi:creatinine amidohydrolase